MIASLTLDVPAIAAACRLHDVARLQVFGSALTSRFDAESSDLDLLVEFLPDAEKTFQAFFALREELEAIVGRQVDLVDVKTLRNPYFMASVTRTAEEIYAA